MDNIIAAMQSLSDVHARSRTSFNRQQQLEHDAAAMLLWDSVCATTRERRLVSDDS